ncbi:MAG: hypothetical protein ACFFDN_21245, partial [Candidatus Hodarchaeota archaeon]
MERFTNLSPAEWEILKIAEQMIDKDKILDLKVLQKIAKFRLGLSDEKISKNIYSLILKKLI